MKIIDCFTFYNELDMLKYRMTVLKHVVDTFVLVEANITHNGFPKPMTFEAHRDEFSEFADKIVYVPVTDMPLTHDAFTSKDDAWVNEGFQRNCIQRGLDSLHLHDEDVIILSDVDEIPHPVLLASIQRGDTKVSLQKLEQDMYYYNLNTRFFDKWYHAKIVSHAKLRDMGSPLNDIRAMSCPTLRHGGWHLSYFGSADQIQNKIMNFAHQEYNADTFTNLDHIRDAIRKGACLFGRPITLTQIPLHRNTNVPPRARDLLARFIRF